MGAPAGGSHVNEPSACGLESCVLVLVLLQPGDSLCQLELMLNRQFARSRD